MELATRAHYRLLLYLYSLAIVFLGAVIAGGGVFLTLPAGLGEGYHAVQASLRNIQQVLFWKTAILYAVIAALIIAAMVVLHLFYSHRIAGPVYRIGLEAAKIARGNLAGNVKLREKDNLMDMAEALNDVAARYRNRMAAVKDSLSLLEVRSQAVAELIKQGKSGQELQRTTEAVMSGIQEVESSLSGMRT